MKHVLIERHNVWEDARDLAKHDPEIDLSGTGAAYQPTEDISEMDGMPEAEEPRLDNTSPEVVGSEKESRLNP